eukprot:11162284-Lingulodinium_polyedra.AAC.1
MHLGLPVQRQKTATQNRRLPCAAQGAAGAQQTISAWGKMLLGPSAQTVANAGRAIEPQHPTTT